MMTTSYWCTTRHAHAPHVCISPVFGLPDECGGIKSLANGPQKSTRQQLGDNLIRYTPGPIVRSQSH